MDAPTATPSNNPPTTTARPVSSIPADSQALKDSAPPTQAWTPSGYPIVDGKYLDLSTGELKTHTSGVDLVMGGPPSLSVSWRNMHLTGRPGQFLGVNKVIGHAGDLSEYLIRLGGFCAWVGVKCWR